MFDDTIDLTVSNVLLYSIDYIGTILYARQLDSPANVNCGTYKTCLYSQFFVISKNEELKSLELIHKKS